jgi:hypothetical protein
MATKNNFFKETRADFKLSNKVFTMPPDYISVTKSKVTVKNPDEEFKTVYRDANGNLIGARYYKHYPNNWWGIPIPGDFLSFVKSIDYGEYDEEYPGYSYSDIRYRFQNESREYVSSLYWYTKTGVYRLSDHWGHVASCKWSLLGKGVKPCYEQEDGYIIEAMGFCKWNDFEKKN